MQPNYIYSVQTVMGWCNPTQFLGGGDGVEKSMRQDEMKAWHRGRTPILLVQSTQSL